MTQTEYNIIVQCIKSGVPALANELIMSLNNLVVSTSEKSEKPTEKSVETGLATKQKSTKKKGEN